MARTQRTEFVAEPVMLDPTSIVDGGEILDVHHYDSERAALADVASLLDSYPEAEHVAIARRDVATFEYTYLERIHRDGRREDLRVKPEPKVQGPKVAPTPANTIGAELSNGVVFDDGGRAAAGFRGSAGDCVARAVAIASGRDYAEVYKRLADGQASNRRTKRTVKSGTKRSARNGVYTGRKWFSDYMTELGFEWTPTMSIGSGCKVHLRADELPAGRLVVSLSKHVAAVIDGVIRDTYDCTRDGTRCVYGYWRKV